MRSKYVTIVIHVLFWGAVLLLPFFFASPPEHSVEIGGVRFNFFTLTNIMHMALFYFNTFFLYTYLMTRSRWWIYLVCLVALVISFYQVKMWMLHAWFPVLVSHKAAFQITFFPTIYLLVISIIYRLVRDKIVSEKARTRREADQLTTELKFLRSQVSPHFLFNVLNNLVSMARHRSDKLEPSLIKLSSLMRYMLYESDEKKVPIDIEIEYLKSYIELQKMRFEDDIDIDVDIRSGEHPRTIEPMLLIPLVENAFKHGIALVQKPFIRVDLNITDNTLLFKVENKFGKRSQSRDNSSGIGLSNLKARLNLLYPRHHQLSVDQTDNVFRITLSLKLK